MRSRRRSWWVGFRRSAAGWLAVVGLSVGTSFAKEPMTLPELPEAISSFGAAVSGNHLYVYGGHVGRAHQHSTDNIANSFLRINLTDSESDWESLPSGPLLQGLALVAHGAHLYRIGGMCPRNSADEDPSLYSLNEVARYVPNKGEWEALTPLPEGRSSHDAVVVGDFLYVLGGWNLRGDSYAPETSWHTTGFVADLRVEPLEWQEVASPPFQRRALAVAAADQRIFVLGGITPEGGVSQRIDVLDLTTGRWSIGPEFPVPTSDRRSMKGFGMSAFGVGDRIFACGAEGAVYELPARGGQWHKTDLRLATPRFFHRVVPYERSLLFIAGAAPRKGHVSDIEVFETPRTTVN